MSDNNPSFDPILDAFIWGATAIAQAANMPSPRAAYHAMQKGYLDADKVGWKWRSTLRRLSQSGGANARAA
jgi:hypothetical protein